MADSAMTIMFEGKSYAIEDFTLGELERIEDESGQDIDDLSGIKSALYFVAAIKRRTNPDVTLEDVRGLTLRQLDESTAEQNGANGAAGKKKRPTKQAKAPSASSAGS